jgi:hypothetical protein
LKAGLVDVDSRDGRPSSCKRDRGRAAYAAACSCDKGDFSAKVDGRYVSHIWPPGFAGFKFHVGTLGGTQRPFSKVRNFEQRALAAGPGLGLVAANRVDRSRNDNYDSFDQTLPIRAKVENVEPVSKGKE